MRIIGGNLKGKKILLPADKNTRPLRDLVKESIFNIIDHNYQDNLIIKGSNVLDLFSGSGSFGLECFSRGSENITFIENYKKATEILKKNILKSKAEKNCKIIEHDCFDFLNSKMKISFKYDLIFIDPPYREKKINIIIDKILKNKLLKKNGLIIIHRHKNDDVIINEKLNILDKRLYGVSKIIFGN
ncbi:16S rRNA (guanine(966)-N(2))-methyltransferase RsmD [Pelagibacterales bacterium SAG-MED39]|nr:16S rRNA (guanine(966)-N(2))-methyltransferase RsmD [Pelagibacterales bacterium SAG-MED39]